MTKCTHLDATDDRESNATTKRVTKTEDAINFIVNNFLADSLLALFFQKFNCRREKGRLESNCMNGETRTDLFCVVLTRGNRVNPE
jgi:hypothetical protein